MNYCLVLFLGFQKVGVYKVNIYINTSQFSRVNVPQVSCQRSATRSGGEYIVTSLLAVHIHRSQTLKQAKYCKHSSHYFYSLQSDFLLAATFTGLSKYINFIIQGLAR